MTDGPTVTVTGRAAIGGRRVFGPLEVEIPGGRWTCLLGPSGVGKSTILRLVAGLGDGIDFKGRIATGDGLPLAGRVALMAQDDLLMPWLSVRENVGLGATLRGAPRDAERVARVLDRVELSALADRRPETLSGGQRQRVALARTLVEDRPVVLLDEPFSALDARTRATMQDLSFELLAGRTVLHVTHDAAEAARLGHRVLLMSGEGIAAAALPDDRPPRGIDAPATLSLQGRLLRQLMALR